MAGTPGRQGSDAHADVEACVLAVVSGLVAQLHPRRRDIVVRIDSHLDRELGFDSLTRVELLLRVEEATGVSVPEDVLATAETPRDLVREVLRGEPRVASPAPLTTIVASAGAAQAPRAATTLHEVLAWHAQLQPTRTHVLLYEGASETPRNVTYADLDRGAHAIAHGLLGRGVESGEAVAIMLPTSQAYLETFMGIVLAGAVPVPIYPPTRPSQLEDHLRRHARILDNADARLLVAGRGTEAVGRLLKAQVPGLRGVVAPDVLAAVAKPSVDLPARTTDDVALLQYTSGSTGQPKGVVLTHAQVLANIRAIGTVMEVGPDDVFVSWLPLYHDMGLIGAWLGSLYYAMPLVLMSPLAFLARPSRWLRRIHQHRATISAAPNFAYQLCIEKIDDPELEALDLSSWRLAFNGAEPVSPHTVRQFGERFARCGLRGNAQAPVYGLAEVAVGLAFPPVGRGPLIDRLQRDAFERTGEAVPANADDRRALEFVACGQPLPGYEIRIEDEAGRELPDRHEGRVEFRGPSATRGYLRNPDATARLFHGDWLDSGDLGYIAEGDVYLTSRIKDLIIRAGRNIYPYELEEAVGDIEGIRKGCVAVFGTKDPTLSTERLIVLAETRETEPGVLAQLKSRVLALASDVLGVAPDDVVLVPPRIVLKTSSGKIRRAACRELYEHGDIDKGTRAVWRQVVRLWLSGAKPGTRRLARRAATLGFALRAQATFWMTTPLVWLLVALLPTVRARWMVVHAAARFALWVSGLPVTVSGREHVPFTSGCVLVSNHASYLDGLVLAALLPRAVSFVVKGELVRRFVPRVFLRRLNATFVERFDAQQGVADARRAAAHAGTGAPLLFFAEGTFTRVPGLLPFHLGAFAAASDVNVPVVPVTLRGTRSILRSDTWFPRRSAVSVRFGAPIAPMGRDWDAVVRLRDDVRDEILAALGEPDLAHVATPIVERVPA